MLHLTSRAYLELTGAAGILLAAVMGCWLWVTTPLRHARDAFVEGRWSLAVQEGQEYLETHPDSTLARLVVARGYFELGRWDAAEQHFSRIKKLPSEDQERLAVALTHLNRFDAAVDLYQQMINERPDDPQLLQQLAAVLIPQNKFDQAIELCNRLAEFPSHQRAAYFLMATTCYQRADYAASVEYFNRLLEDDPELSDRITQRSVFWEDYGSALLKLGRLDAAKQQLERAVVLHRRPEIFDLLAQVHEAQHDVDRAERFYLQSLAQDPSYVPALRALARLSLQRGQPDRSVEFLVRALEFAPNDVSIQTNLGAAYMRAGQGEQAAVHLNRANQLRELQDLREQLVAQVRGNPNAPELRMLEVIRDMEQQHLVEAETGLRAILRENPDFAAAKKLLEVLGSQP